MNIEQIKKEIQFRTARSGGKGGQNVNKVETKAEAVFAVEISLALSDREKAVLMEKLASKISGEGLLSSVNQTDRSQLSNKKMAEQKLIAQIELALRPDKKRKKTHTPTRVVEARRRHKKIQSEKKSLRKNWLGEF